MVIGHHKIIRLLKERIKRGNFPQAVLFSGPAKIGKRKIALELADYILGGYSSDPKRTSSFSKRSQFLSEIGREEEEEIKIGEIRKIKQNLSLKSNFPKIVIIDNAEKLTKPAMVALLKTLEEPKNAIFFLISAYPSMLSSTILSRVEEFRFHKLSRKQIRDFLLSHVDSGLEEKTVNKILDYSLGRPGVAKELAIDKDRILYYDLIVNKIREIRKLSSFEKLEEANKIEKEKNTDLFTFLAKYWFRDLWLAQAGIKDFSFKDWEQDIKKDSQLYSENYLKNLLKEVEQTRNYLLFSNINNLLSLENLILTIH